MTDADSMAGGPAGPDASRRRSRTALVVSTVVLGVVAVLLAAACVVVLVWPTAVPGESAAEKADDRSLAVQSAATRAMKAFLDVDYRDMDARIDKVVALSTGTFKNQYQTVSADLKGKAEEAKTVASGSVVRVALGDVDEDTAVVYVAADSTVSNTETERQQAAGEEADGTRSYRFQLTMTKVGHRWLLSELEGLS
jgi:hypothetical protein